MTEESIEMSMLRNELESVKAAASMARSNMINTMLDLKVMLADDDIDEVRDLVEELTSDVARPELEPRAIDVMISGLVAADDDGLEWLAACCDQAADKLKDEAFARQSNDPVYQRRRLYIDFANLIAGQRDRL